MSALIEMCGSIAAFCTTLAFLPQVIRVWRTKSADDISLATFSLLSFGVFMWLVYGFGIGSMPIIVGNAITLIFALSILIMKIRYSSKSASVRRTFQQSVEPRQNSL